MSLLQQAFNYCFQAKLHFPSSRSGNIETTDSALQYVGQLVPLSEWCGAGSATEVPPSVSCFHDITVRETWRKFCGGHHCGPRCYSI